MRIEKQASAVSRAQHSLPADGLVESLRVFFGIRLVQLTALLIALGCLTWITLKLKFSVTDLDVYWHLAVGDWIVQHGSVPHTGILSRTAADLPWIAYSWGSEVLLSRAYAWFGLMGLGGFGSALTFMVALTLLWSLQRLTGFWTALLLCAATCVGSLFSLAPRPVFFSMALFVVVLAFVLEAERSGNRSRLWWLPPIFLLWANLHIQFIYGLFLLGLLLVPPVLQWLAQLNVVTRRWTESHVAVSNLSFPQLAALFATCTLATCVGPYGYHLYGVVLSYGRAKLTYSTIQELQPASYTHLEQYIPLLMTAFAFYALGKQKRISLYQLLLLTIATLVSVRTVRDTWFICFTAAMLIAESTGSLSGRVRKTHPWRQLLPEIAGVCVAWGFLTLILAQATEFNARGLNRAVSVDFPVDACNYLRGTLPPGPMYNSFNWGGFLTWYLPMYPVAADGRNDLYDGPLGNTLLHTESDANYYRQNPYLIESGFVLVDAKGGLARQLSLDSTYRRVYGDGTAEVYVHNEP